VSADLRGALAAAKNTGGGLCLPPNFILVGTVNMDETTQPFSRKVLDRACTLEFNDVDLKHGFARSAGVASTPASAVSATELVAEFLTLTDLLPANQPAAEKVADFLTTLNQHLILAGLEVGYRIRDEGAAYFVYARQAGMTEEQALHSIALQKVLPRVQGSSPRLEKVLAGLTQHFAGGTAPDAQADDLNEKLAALRRDGSAKPVVRKLAGMWLTLREEGFTSFWLT
jgi:5-methylcytosine-specific restriction protein B